MQRNDENSIAIHILDKEFLIHCPDDARAELLASAKFLDQRMRQIKSAGRVYGLERISVMAALNLSHELLQARQEIAALTEAASNLDERISQALAQSSDE